MQDINQAFEKLISARAAYKKIGVTPDQVKQARHKIRHGKGLVTDKLKRTWLLATGHRPAFSEMWYSPEEAMRKDYEPEKFNSLDMISFAKFYYIQSQAARSQPDYCLEKFLNKQNV